ncbi:hypothetical protein Bealeia2_01937 (plasmid) [Candidatus Bealeia paramacronuclearis]|nr:hypothetical protein [Candidatus Bealeia paramacronuclearis]
MSTMTWHTLVGTREAPGQIMTYLSTQNEQVFDQLPNFINQAEQRICREAHTIGLETYISGTLEPNQAVFNKPARWRRSLSFGIWDEQDRYRQLEFRNYELLRMWSSAIRGPAQPQFYGDYNYASLLLSPAPDQPYKFEYAYMELPVPLSDTQQTNWLTDFAPDVLLYAILLEATPFVMTDQRIPVWESAYARGIASLNQEDAARQVDRAADNQAD